jgi:hypothetical protein
MVSKLRVARCLAVVAAFAVMFASSATCIAAVSAAAPEATCHDAQQRAGGHGSIDQGCCPGEAPNTKPLTSASFSLGTAVPSPVVIAVLPAAPAATGTMAVALVHAPAGSSKPPGIATYVFVSSFRI